MTNDVDTAFQPLLDDDELFDEGLIDTGPRPSRRRRIWVISLVAVVVVLVLVSGGVWLWLVNQQPAVHFTEQTATTGNISVKISTTGPINASGEYALNFASAGQISEIDTQVGQQVKQGQTLAKITVDTTALNDTLHQAQLSVTSAQNNLDAAEVALTNAQTDLTNQKAQNSAALSVAQDQNQTDLTVCNTPTAAANCQQTAQDKLKQTQAQLAASLTSAQEKVTSAQNQITSAQNSLATSQNQEQTAQHNLDTANTNANLVAPVDATVAAITGVVGQSVGSSGTAAASGSSSSGSSSSSQAFIILTNTSNLTITAQVNEADIGNVQAGQPAQFTVAAYPSNTFRATVSAIQTIGQTTSNVVTYPVLLTVDQNSLQNTHLYPGMTATVDITTAQRIGALLIPSSALSFPSIALQNNEIDRTAVFSSLRGGRGGTTGSSTATSGQQGSSRVILRLVNGKLTPTTITVGLNSGQMVEVLSGLQDGDNVVVSQTGGNTVPANTTGGRTGGAGAGGGGFGGGAGGAGGGGAGGGGGTRGG